nr:sialidase family protein [uncultured Sphingomonas sp.]
MAKISELPELVDPTGDEPVVVFDRGETKRIRMGLLASAAAAPQVALAQAAARQAVEAVQPYQYVDTLTVGPGATAGTGSQRGLTRILGKTLAEYGLVGPDGLLTAFSVLAIMDGSGVFKGKILEKTADLTYRTVAEATKTITASGPVVFTPADFGLAGSKVQPSWTFGTYSSSAGAQVAYAAEPAFASAPNSEIGSAPAVVVAAATAPAISATVKHNPITNKVAANANDIAGVAGAQTTLDQQVNYSKPVAVGSGATAGTGTSRNFTRVLGKTFAEYGLVGDDGVLAPFSVHAVHNGSTGVLVGMVVEKLGNLSYRRVGYAVTKTIAADGPVTFAPSEFGLKGNKVLPTYTLGVYSSSAGAFISVSTEPAFALSNAQLGTSGANFVTATTAPRISGAVLAGTLNARVATLEASAGSTTPRAQDIARHAGRKGTMKIFPLVRSSLNTFDPGRGGYPVPRIPAVGVHPITKRTFLLFDGRMGDGQDYDPSALVMRTADDVYYVDDPNAAWSGETVLAYEEGYQFASSAIMFRANGEITIMFKVHRTATVTSEAQDPATAYYLYEIVSRDNGVTWQNRAGVPIALPATRATASRVSVIEAAWLRAGCGPGGGITMNDGTLCVPGWSNLTGLEGDYQLFPMFLRPGALTWTRGQLAPAGLKASESTVFQREDGRIEMNSRSNDYARRITTVWEADGTFVSQTIRSDLPVAFTCEGHALRLSGMDQDRPNRVLLSYPERASGDGTGAGDRTKLSVGLSFDDLATMPYFRRIWANVTDTERVDYLGNALAGGPVQHTHHTAYSTMAALSGNRVLIIWEGSMLLPDGTTRGGLWAGIFNLSWLLGNN